MGGTEIQFIEKGKIAVSKVRSWKLSLMSDSFPASLSIRLSRVSPILSEFWS